MTLYIMSEKKIRHKFCLQALRKKGGHKIRKVKLFEIIKLNDVCKIHSSELNT